MGLGGCSGCNQLWMLWIQLNKARPNCFTYIYLHHRGNMQPLNFLLYNASGSFHIHLPQKPDTGTVTASLYLPSGGANGTGSVTVETASSTVNAAATFGATTLNIGSTTSFKVGHRYLVGNTDPDDYTAEHITIKSKTTNTIRLMRPLLWDHASGDPLVSTQVQVDLTPAQTSQIGVGHRVEIAYSVSGSAQPLHIESFTVARYLPISHLNIETLRDLDPTLSKKIPSGLSWVDFRDSTWEMVLNRVALNYSPGALVGTVNLTQPHAFFCRMSLAELAGPDYMDYRNMMAQRFDEELKAALGSAVMDNDQDGSTTGKNDKYVQQMRLIRR